VHDGVYDAYGTIEVPYMDQSKSTKDPPPLSSDVVDDTAQYGKIRTRLFYRQVTGQAA